MTKCSGNKQHLFSHFNMYKQIWQDRGRSTSQNKTAGKYPNKSGHSLCRTVDRDD